MSKGSQSTFCAGRLGPWSDIPWFRPGIPGDSSTCPKPSGSTSSPRRLGPGSEALGVDQLSRETRA